jgi:hypothetical protein
VPAKFQKVPASGARAFYQCLYIWSANFIHSDNEKSEAKMAAIDVQ